ncbi:hypothetical protein [Apilactobacillus timberlakei]|uniref:hypothetical protein n=1 Tax=Apilactobacillus timberlakei TaxID=2008380 RepID=UPI0011293F7C|nr:hypothetical protein [Apilactobacillus timberlakei]TPR16753.1 hypothetical protein DYZ95_07165 [Apilactobacillus timberlakei]TPR21516.1 hypothetical protein DY083_05715 [Apilactobacillus timberlakei]
MQLKNIGLTKTDEAILLNQIKHCNVLYKEYSKFIKQFKQNEGQYEQLSTLTEQLTPNARGSYLFYDKDKNDNKFRNDNSKFVFDGYDFFIHNIVNLFMDDQQYKKMIKELKLKYANSIRNIIYNYLKQNYTVDIPNTLHKHIDFKLIYKNENNLMNELNKWWHTVVKIKDIKQYAKGKKKYDSII